MAPLAVAVTRPTTMIVAPPFGAMSPSEQGKPVQPPWLLLTIAFSTSPGRTSVTTTLRAVLGPLLVMVMR